jgi:hypothetical protein
VISPMLLSGQLCGAFGGMVDQLHG